MDGVKFLSWLGRILLLLLLTAALAYLVRRLFPGVSRSSDALILLGLIEVIAAGSALYRSPSETSGAIWVRYMVGVPPNENRDERPATFWADMFARQSFAGQALLCGLVTVAAAVIMSLFGR